VARPIIEDQPLVESGLAPAVYTMIGTSGAQVFAAGDTVINEMTLTLTCAPGDVILAMFDGTIRLQPLQGPRFSIRINGVQIGERTLHYTQDAPQLDRRAAPCSRAFQVTVAGPHLIEVILNLGGGDTAMMPGNERTLTVLHFR